MLEVVFSDEAEKDLDEIREWYCNIREGLEKEFLICLEAEINLIRKEPLIYKEYFNKVRKALVNRFPYGVFYLYEEERIFILAIAHHKRRTKEVRKKLKKK